ncbi:glycosyltransferase family 3 protein [Postia placenta MAD-698-R-SB12]|uniref:Glycogen [starch] synthase n=1 Tax=Postia placenta MAD-698-R-SB12 TaxID=670580 RepID=A0A1X6N701_9APHY|nr:glycosyltransferase family 3 protein [Postia placenta MAD-698-R-SB12]OSX64397.1 glycosyltransferase family 3 protein [Postia placenta MAD-698-R-SB12]
MTNLSGFGCFMQDLIQRPQDEGCYIVDWHSQSVEDSVSQQTDHMFSFCQKTRRQRINQTNRVERLSPLLDWKNLGIKYLKARQLALERRRGARLWHGAHDAKLGPHEPALPHVRLRDPSDIGTLTEEMRMSGTSNYRSYQWPRHMEDEDEGHPM